MSDHGSTSVSQVVDRVIRSFGLESVLHQYPEALPYATRRLVGIARALATSPSVLLLDEPAAGLDDKSTHELAALIRDLAHEWGIAVLLVEHDVAMVMATCDRVIALEFGRICRRVEVGELPFRHRPQFGGEVQFRSVCLGHWFCLPIRTPLLTRFARRIKPCS